MGHQWLLSFSHSRHACLIQAYVSNRYVWLADQQGQGLLVPDFLQSRVSPCITHRMGATSRMGEVDVFLNYLAVNFFTGLRELHHEYPFLKIFCSSIWSRFVMHQGVGILCSHGIIYRGFQEGGRLFLFFSLSIWQTILLMFFTSFYWLITNLLQCVVKALHETAAEMTLRLHHLSDTVDNYVRFIMRKLEAVKTDLENLVMISEFYVCCLYNSKASFFLFYCKIRYNH